ncbi:MAG: hypothetical protein ACREL7_03660 [Longimicrobiales bacterium]
MTTRNALVLAALIVFAAPLSSCASPAVIQGALVLISNTWENVADTQHSFSLASGDDGEREGTFTGTEQHDTNPALDGNDLTGSWANSEITFTVVRQTGSVTYTGELTEDGLDQITFTTNTGAHLTLRRRQN